ncbi:MAG: DUF6519 domain-containing protein [Cellulomonas sp.]
MRKWGAAMHGDFSRWTFAAANSYRAVALQQGRVLLDSDWNEQTRLTAHHDEARTLDVVGRSGGPLPEDGGPGPFAILGADGLPPVGAAWADLVVTPGRYYVDGILAESFAPPPGSVGWSLVDQPYLATIGAGVAADPGLPEPPTSPDGTRYALYLEVWEHEVTADEAPSLRESALGGPDTSTRAQTVWQVRWERLTGADQCTDLHAADWLARSPRALVAALRPAEDDADPCRISTTGGYRRLENQLYRVQVHSPGDSATPPTFVWSRENGSVVSGLVGIATSVLPGVDAVLRLDRVGRDEELSIRQGDLLEVTSTDRALRRLPGFLARAGSPDGLDLPITWSAGSPTSLAALGRAPIVRRWEGGPIPAAATATDLEDGITVRFPAGGQAATGDYWQIPARAVRLAYGLSELRGTIDWPMTGTTPRAMPPAGPGRHVTPLGIVRRTGTVWTRESDCRLLFPPLTGVVSLDLVGGDGQEDLPGEWLDEAVRVVVRNGGVPVEGALVEFTLPDGGRLANAVGAAAPPVGVASPLTLSTGPEGVAAVRWILDATGSTTQSLHARRLDDHLAGIDVDVVATARLAVATEVAWSRDDCEGFAQVSTVAGALDRLVTRPELRLRGGDGQHLPVTELVLPQPVRVIVDNPCGPMKGVPVGARALGAALVTAAVEGDTRPTDLTGVGADVADATTDADGGALFWWQPDLTSGSDVLEIRLPGDDPHAPIVVTAQREAIGRRPGVHLDKLDFGVGKPFANDSTIAASLLASGIVVFFDGPIDPEAAKGKPVARVELDLPWPFGADGDLWSDRPVGTRSVTLAGDVVAEDRMLRWDPTDASSSWFRDRMWIVLRERGWDAPILGRFFLEGWALPTLDPKGLQVNTHADAVLRNGRTDLVLPTDDENTGGTFVQWFRLHSDQDQQPPRVVPELIGLTLAGARRVLRAAEITLTEVRTEAVAGVPKGRVAKVDPAAGTELAPDAGVVVVVADGR